MYAYINQIGSTVVSVELPDDVHDYIEFNEFPETGGIPYIVDGELIFVPAPVEPVPTSDPGPTPSGDYDEFIAGLMEGYKNG